MNRQEHVLLCKQENSRVLNGKYRLKYKRDKHGRPVGLVISFKDEANIVRVGWSKCNTKLEQFDKHIGINKAISNTYSLESAEFISRNGTSKVLPNSLREDVKEMVERASRYFKLDRQNG